MVLKVFKVYRILLLKADFKNNSIKVEFIASLIYVFRKSYESYHTSFYTAFTIKMTKTSKYKNKFPVERKLNVYLSY